MQDGLVAIAIAQHEVALRDCAVPHDLVRSRRATDHEQRLVRAEDARRVALALRDRSGVIEQRAQFTDGHRDVGAQRVLAEELVEELANRALAESYSAAVTGGVPRVAGMQRVIHE